MLLLIDIEEYFYTNLLYRKRDHTLIKELEDLLNTFPILEYGYVRLFYDDVLKELRITNVRKPVPPYGIRTMLGTSIVYERYI